MMRSLSGQCVDMERTRFLGRRVCAWGCTHRGGAGTECATHQPKCAIPQPRYATYQPRYPTLPAKVCNVSAQICNISAQVYNTSTSVCNTRVRRHWLENMGLHAPHPEQCFPALKKWSVLCWCVHGIPGVWPARLGCLFYSSSDSVLFTMYMEHWPSEGSAQRMVAVLAVIAMPVSTLRAFITP